VRDAKALARFLRSCAFTAENWFTAAQEERARADALQAQMEAKDAALANLRDLLDTGSRAADRAMTPASETELSLLLAQAAHRIRNPKPAAGKRAKSQEIAR
jgi:hypothetical protein